MDQLITITNTKQNIIEFEADVNGVDRENIKARFCIETSDMDLVFPCKRLDHKWEVTIPPCSILERTAYNFYIDIIADGYYFEPMRGTVNVVGSPEIYTTDPQNKTVGPASKPDDKETEIVFTTGNSDIKPTETKKKAGEEGIAAIAKRLMSQQVQEEKTKPVGKDNDVLKIIEESKKTKLAKKKVVKKRPAKKAAKKERVEEQQPAVISEKEQKVRAILEQVNPSDQKKKSSVKYKKIGILSSN